MGRKEVLVKSVLEKVQSVFEIGRKREKFVRNH